MCSVDIAATDMCFSVSVFSPLLAGMDDKHEVSPILSQHPG